MDATHYLVHGQVKFQFDFLVSGASNNNNTRCSFSLKLLSVQSVSTAVSAEAQMLPPDGKVVGCCSALTWPERNLIRVPTVYKRHTHPESSQVSFEKVTLKRKLLAPLI